MSRGLKLCFFTATVESILLYGCEAWTTIESQESTINCTYTRMLQKALNVHTTNEELYGDLPCVSDKIASRKLQLASFCFRHPKLSTQPLVL